MLKFFINFGPFLVFFIGYAIGGIFEATLYLLVASVIGISITYITERKINTINLISTSLVLITASLTLFSGNSVFIKIKPTVLYCIFACILLVTHFKWGPAIKFALGTTIKFKEEKNWYRLNLRFICFFLTMAIINEIIWRNFSEATWVSFKVFGTMPITMIFVLSQIPFIIKHKTPKNSISTIK